MTSHKLLWVIKSFKNWPKVYKTFLMLNSVSMKFYQPINNKVLISTVVFLLKLAEYEVFSAYRYKNANISGHFLIYQQRKFHAQLS